MTIQIGKKKNEASLKPPLDVFRAAEEQGLTTEQAEARAALGYINRPVDPPSKTVSQIVLGNIFTYFNIVFFILAAFVIAVRSWNNLMFMGVVVLNTAIGIVQELRSKKTLDKLTLLNSPKGTVVRYGQRFVIDTAELVRDDIVFFTTGNQIYADAEVL